MFGVHGSFEGIKAGEHKPQILAFLDRSSTSGSREGPKGSLRRVAAMGLAACPRPRHASAFESSRLWRVGTGYTTQSGLVVATVLEPSLRSRGCDRRRQEASSLAHQPASAPRWSHPPVDSPSGRCVAVTRNYVGVLQNQHAEHRPFKSRSDRMYINMFLC